MLLVYKVISLYKFLDILITHYVYDIIPVHPLKELIHDYEKTNTSFSVRLMLAHLLLWV